MKFHRLNLFIVVAMCLSLTFIACDDDEDTNEPPGGGDPCETIGRTLSMDVMPILDQTCAIPNCHVDGFINGDFTVFEELRIFADNGTLVSQITSGAMPPSNTTGPTEVTDEELEIIQCWIADGAQDN